jgi:gamma-glutamyltranspeptidase/glutathione hydrolase
VNLIPPARVLFAAALVLLILSLPVVGAATAEEGSRFEEPVRSSSGGVVATESPAASEVGLEALDSGGNAVDAAVAATFALNVARPQSCGIGGGGFMVYRGADGRTDALDFRETAPEAITADAFTGSGIYTTYTGHKTVGVPGTVAGMQAALDRYGTYTLAEALAPAESLARSGVAVTEDLAREMGNHQARLELFPAAREQFLADGEKADAEADLLVQPDLADTFALIAREGPDAFYRGEIADAIVADMKAAGDYPGDEGLMTRADLASYEAKWREPLVGEYRGREVVAMPPPTSGGVAILEMLNLLEGYDLRRMGQSSADSLHVLAEAQKLAFADREEYLADPDFVDVPTRELTSKGYADERRAEIRLDKAKTYEPGDLRGAGGRGSGGDNPEGSTTHVSVIDARGNAVALTCTIEQSFGSAVVAPGTGFLLNNELTDFSEPGAANEPEGGKRPRSSISPTIVVEGGEPLLVTGAAGGSTIIEGTLLSVVNTVDYGLDPARAVDAERIDASVPDTLTIEDGRVSPVVQNELADRGHALEREGEYADLPRVQAAGTDLETGERLAATDPRSGEPASLGQGGATLPDTGGMPLGSDYLCGSRPVSGPAFPC